MTEQAVRFLKNVQIFVQSVESLLIDTVSAVIPWAAPLLPAHLIYRHLTELMAFPVWIALASAAVVELLGLATVNTCFNFWYFNQSQPKLKAPLILAAFVALFYLFVVLTVNTMLDRDPFIFKLAKGLLSSLSIAGALVIALRASHNKRLAQLEADKTIRKVERQNRRVITPLIQEDSNLPILVQQPLKIKRDWRTLSFEDKVQIKGLSVYDIIQNYNVPSRTASHWKELSRNGKVTDFN